MSKISPLASIDPHAHIGCDVEIGPFCVIGPDVVIHDGCRLYNNVTVLGHTTLGNGNVIYPNAVIGTPPQDLKYRGGPTRVEIGENNQIREAVTIQCGTETGAGITRLGSNNLLMVNCHIGHDAQFGSKCIIGNNAMVAGHVECNDGVAMMGGVGIHHFVTIGEYAYIGGYARIHHDVPPFVKVDGADRVRALNALGLKRHGFSEEDVEALENAARRLFFGREKPFNVTLAEFDLMNGLNPRVKRMLDFLRRRNEGRHGRYLEAHRMK
ncbi:MAG: acyl-ACP--UDP-N-acetylglucosamine O-acyltransferase [Burkholderiales bacterium]|nr:acyl-ACP--UDP-N-acetylglucosamine O-acyltransferase [Phycisphaerae bacterium]